MTEPSSGTEFDHAPPALIEVRLLDGPNLYFPRPAAKVTLRISGLLAHRRRAGARASPSELGLRDVRPGEPGSSFRQRFAARTVTRLVRKLALAGGVKRLAVRSRSGLEMDQLVIAYPWRNSGRAEVLAEGVARALEAVGTRSAPGHAGAGGDSTGRSRARAWRRN